MNVRWFSLILLCCSWFSQAAEPPCAALYCFEGDISIQAFMALAEARLSQGKAVRVLDRANLGALLKEQGLSLAGLTPPEAALQTGKLLHADLVVALEMSPGADTPYGVVVYDAKLGRRLVDRGLPPGKPEALAAELETEVGRAATASRSIPKNATALCVMPVRPAGLPENLGYLPQAAHVLLQRALAGNPELALLERSHLGLKDDDGPGLLRPALLLELELAKGDAGGVVARGALSAADGKRLAALEVAVPKAAPEAVVAALLPELDRLLRVNAPTAGLDPRRESDRFMQEACVLLNCGEYPAALAAAESACALARADGSGAFLGGSLLAEAQARETFFLLECCPLSDDLLATKDACDLIRTEKLVATLGGCQLAEATRLLDGDLAEKPPQQLDRAFSLATAAVRARLDDIPGAGKTEQGLPVRAYWCYKCGYWRFWHSLNLRLLPLVKAAREAEDRGLGAPAPRQAFLDIVRAHIFSVLDSPMALATRKEVDLHLFITQRIFAEDVRDKLALLRSLEPKSPRLPADSCLLLDNFADSCAKHGSTLFAAYGRLLEKWPNFWDTPAKNIQLVLTPAFQAISQDYHNGKFQLTDSGHPYVKFVDKCRRHPLELFRVHAAAMDFCADLRGGSGRAAALARFHAACGEILDGRLPGQADNVLRSDFYRAVVDALKAVRPAGGWRNIDPQAEALALMASRKELCGDLIPAALDQVWSVSRKRELVAQLALALYDPAAKQESLLPEGKALRHSLQAMALAFDLPSPGAPRHRDSCPGVWARRQVLAKGDESRRGRAGGLAFDGQRAFLLRRVGGEGDSPHSYQVLRVDVGGGLPSRAAETERRGRRERCACVPPYGSVGGGFYFAPTRDSGVCVYGLADGSLRMFNTDSGFPADRTEVAVYLDGWLYTVMMSAAKGNFLLKVNPATGDYSVLGASGARGDSSPLGGADRPSWIGWMLACPESKRLLLAMADQEGLYGYFKGRDHRLFEYAIDTGRFRILRDPFKGALFRPWPFAGSYFLRNDHTGLAELLCPGAASGQPVYDYPQPRICSAPPPIPPSAKDVNPKLPPRTDLLRPVAVVDNYLWTLTPFGRVSLATGEMELFPEVRLDEYCKILPSDDGKHVLVVGNFGAALLDMSVK